MFGKGRVSSITLPHESLKSAKRSARWGTSLGSLTILTLTTSQFSNCRIDILDAQMLPSLIHSK